MANGPTTIFNFEAVLDEILVVVNGISENYVTTARFEQILTAVAAQNTQLAVVSSQISAVSAAIDNLTTLWEALLAALSNVATTTLQNQEIVLLQKIVGYTAPTKPISIGIDLKSKVTIPQPVPTRSGP